MTRSFISFFAIIILLFSEAYSTEEAKKEPSCQKAPEDKEIVTSHSFKMNGKEIKYKAATGLVVLNDEKSCPKATISYVAYTKDGVKDNSQRPITFCFNGGPGSSSVWLHLGAYGPRIIALDNQGKPEYPVHLVDNPQSLLDISDLVFIDPVSTGYSRAAPDVEAKQFHGVDEDIKSVGEFIRLYVTRNDRWESPKYLSGESYGTTRAAGLVLHLQDDKNMFFDGVVLVSSILNFQTHLNAQGNDLPYITSMPSYAIAAWYYGRIPHEKYPDIPSLLKDVESFAFNEYANALMKGDALSDGDRKEITGKLMFYTGLPESYIQLTNLRVNKHRFLEEFMRDEKKFLGRFDLRMSGPNYHPTSNGYDFDPSVEIYIGPYTAALNHYMRHDLKWENDEEYQVLASGLKWDFSKATNKYLDVSEDLLEALSKNPRLRIFIAHGYYDLALPFAGTKYTLNHMGLEGDQHQQITFKHYDGGHMMYHDKAVLKQMKSDLSTFYQR